MKKIITAADTPGLGDSMHRDQQFQVAFRDYIQDVGHRLGIDAFLLVFQYDSPLNRYKGKQKKVHILTIYSVMSILEGFHKLMDIFKPKNWWNHVILVFTRVDYYPNLKFPPTVLHKKQSISEVLIPSIQKKYGLDQPPKYAFMSSKPRQCSHAKKGMCDCSAILKYHTDQMKTLKSRISAVLVENEGERWRPLCDV